VTLVAKVAKSSAEVWLEFTVFSKLAGLLGAANLLAVGALTAVFVAIGITFYSVDWERALGRAGIGRNRCDQIPSRAKVL